MNSWNLKINTILEKENHLNQKPPFWGVQNLKFQVVYGQLDIQFKNISGKKS